MGVEAEFYLNFFSENGQVGGTSQARQGRCGSPAFKQAADHVLVLSASPHQTTGTVQFST